MSFELGQRLKHVGAVTFAGLALTACSEQTSGTPNPTEVASFCDEQVTQLYKSELASVPANDPTTEVDEAFQGTAAVNKAWTTEAVGKHLTDCYMQNLAEYATIGMLEISQDFVDANATTLHATLTGNNSSASPSPSASATVS